MDQFRVTEEHIKLIRHYYPFDSKRPFGNKSVGEDISRILGLKYMEDLSTNRRYIGEEYEDVLIERVLEEMPIIVMILCRNAEIQPGLYISDEYQQNWRRAD